MDFRIAAKAVIVQDEKILIIKRRANDSHKPGQWDIPGGRLELGEDPWEGVRREAKEETNVDITPHIPFDLHHFTRDDGQRITMIFFLCTAKVRDVVLSEEHTDYQWVSFNNTEYMPDWLQPVVQTMQRFNLMQAIER